MENQTIVCRRCGEELRNKNNLYHHFSTLHPPPPSKPRPQAYVHEKADVRGQVSGAATFQLPLTARLKPQAPIHNSRADTTVQIPGPATESEIALFRCNVCERNFIKEEALKMHVASSYLHKRQVQMQALLVHAKEVKNTPSSISNTVVSSTTPQGQHLYVGGPSLGSAGIQLPSGRQLRPEYVSAGAAYNPPHLRQPNAVSGMVMSHHCSVCERDFVSDGALLTHIENSKVHKKEAKRQASEAAVAPMSEVKDALSPVSNTVASYMTLHRQHLPVENTLLSLASLRLQSQNNGITNAYTFTHLQQPSTIDNGQSSSSTTYAAADNNVSFQHGKNRWSMIPAFEHSELLEALSRHCHSHQDLLRNQYLLQPYNANDISGLRKCKNCLSLQKKLRNRTECSFHPGKRQAKKQKDGSVSYSCCGKSGQGCTSLPAHSYTDGDSRLVAKYQTFASTPPSSSLTPKRQAVTLDCEMAGIKGGMSELILLCVVDYLTGETLVNSLVRPGERVTDWRTRYSGVTAGAMATATARGEALNGWEEARMELWKHVDAGTILVGHSLQHDLDALRMVHTRVVDSGILTRNAVVGGHYQWGLKTLCQQLLGVGIQSGHQSDGRRGHDCLEDALAAREVVLWCTRNPQALEIWGRIKRYEEVQKAELRKKEDLRKKEELRKKSGEEGKGQKGKEREQVGEQVEDKVNHVENPRKNRRPRRRTNRRDHCTGDSIPMARDTEIEDSDEDEVLRWADIAEDLGWPHPDTGYDPWSD